MKTLTNPPKTGETFMVIDADDEHRVYKCYYSDGEEQFYMLGFHQNHYAPVMNDRFFKHMTILGFNENE